MDFPSKGSINKWFLSDVLIISLSFILRTCQVQMTPHSAPGWRADAPMQPVCIQNPISISHCLVVDEPRGNKQILEFLKNLLLSHPALSPEIFYTLAGMVWRRQVASPQFSNPILSPSSSSSAGGHLQKKNTSWIHFSFFLPVKRL